MGGVDIASSLQVGFMLRALFSCYSAVVTDFCLGRHSLTSATLQTVIKHCMAFDKDPWTGSVGRDGRPVRTPSANTAVAGSGEPSAAYDAMEQVSFNYHFSRWHKCFSKLSEKCLICHNSARSNRHPPSKCPILKKLGLKLEKCSAVDNSNNSAARVASDNSSGTYCNHSRSCTCSCIQRRALKRSPTTLERNSTTKESMKARSTQGKVNLARTVLFTCQFRHHVPIPRPRFPTMIPQLKFPPIQCKFLSCGW
jgi:hypothetical protein